MQVDTRTVRLEAFDASVLSELLTMWRASFEEGVGIKDPHPLEEQRQYFLTQVLPKSEVRVAFLGEEVVGFVAASGGSLDQLYVRCGCQRKGTGTLMLDWAKKQSGGQLSLHTFAQNTRACSFYESRGFTAVARGYEERWKLDDVEYRWQATP